MPGEYVCECCGGTFEYSQEWSDADALMEFQEAFSEEMRSVGSESPALVCDDCYRAMMPEGMPTRIELGDASQKPQPEPAPEGLTEFPLSRA